MTPGRAQRMERREDPADRGRPWGSQCTAGPVASFSRRSRGVGCGHRETDSTTALSTCEGRGASAGCAAGAPAAGLWRRGDSVRRRRRLPRRLGTDRAELGDCGGRWHSMSRRLGAPGVRGLVSGRNRIVARLPRRPAGRRSSSGPGESARRQGATGSADGARRNLPGDDGPAGVQRLVLIARCVPSITIVPQARRFLRESGPRDGHDVGAWPPAAWTGVA